MMEKMIRYVVLCFAILSLILSVLSEIVPIKPCEVNVCELKELKISPCKEAPKRCKLEQGGYASIDFTFVPNFNANDLNATASTKLANGNAYLEGMDNDGCKYTTCPTTAGVEQNYKFNLLIQSYFPKGQYKVRYELFNKENPSETCCIYFDIKIFKSK